MAEEQTGLKKCFYICPIGSADSDTRKKTDGLLREGVRPTLKEMGFDVTASHEMPKPGSITTQVVQRLLGDDLVVADLTGNQDPNPNVMYELAIRHAKGLPVVTIAENGTRLPFDISDERTIFFNRDLFGLSDFKVSLRKATEATLESPTTDNPIYRAVREKVIFEDVDRTGTDVTRELLALIREMRDSEVIVSRQNLAKDSPFRFEHNGEQIEGVLRSGGSDSYWKIQMNAPGMEPDTYMTNEVDKDTAMRNAVDWYLAQHR